MTTSQKSYVPVFLTGSLALHLFRMAAATYAALLVVQLADLLVLAYVSAIGNQVEVAGLGVAMTIFFLGFIVNMGGSVAVTAIVAFSSVNDSDEVLRRKTINSIAWMVVGGALSTALIFLGMDWACSFLGVEGATREVVIRYLTILAPVNAIQALAK